MKHEKPTCTERLQELEKNMIESIEEYDPFYEKEVNYEYVHFTMESLLEVAQKCLFLEEESLSESTRTHIYNVLEVAKGMLNKDEYELLNQLATYARIYKEKKKCILSEYKDNNP